jgi:integrase
MDACSAHGPYAPPMRALLEFSAFTLMRPSEVYELEWADIDFDAMRIRTGNEAGRTRDTLRAVFLVGLGRAAGLRRAQLQPLRIS